MTRTESSTSGFTLLEVIVVLCTMGMVIALALPIIGFRNPLKETARRIVGTIGALRDAAAFSKETHRLYFDLDRQMYWATILSRDGERLYSHPGFADPISLREPVRIGEVAIPHYGKLSTGKAVVELRPDGRVDPAEILLLDEDQHVLWLTVDRYSGHVHVGEQALAFTPRPLSAPMLSLFRPLRPASSTPRM